jgi:hypothetical protein
MNSIAETRRAPTSPDYILYHTTAEARPLLTPGKAMTFEDRKSLRPAGRGCRASHSPLSGPETDNGAHWLPNTYNTHTSQRLRREVATRPAKGPRGYNACLFVNPARHSTFSLLFSSHSLLIRYSSFDLSAHYAPLGLHFSSLRPDSCPWLWQLLGLWPASLSPTQTQPPSRMRIARRVYSAP